MDKGLTFIYDGECPFCNHFAELLEIKSKLNNISIIDGRKNEFLLKELKIKGFDLDNGAILLKEEEILHGSDAINFICKQINNPSDNLLKILTNIFKSSKRTKLFFPILVTARRLILISRGVPTSIV